MKGYKEAWLSKYKGIPKAAHGFPTCMYTVSLESWRRGLKVRFNMKRRKSIMNGLSYTITDGHKIHTFYGARGDATTREAINSCADKGKTLKLLKKGSIPVPEGRDFPSKTTTQELLNYAEALGYPLVLKPSTGGGGGGFGVVTNIKSKEEMEKHITGLKKILPNSSIIIERFFVGEDFRVNVFNGKVIGAFHRRAQSVVGDGKHTLEGLLKIKNEERNASPFLSTSKIKMDKKMQVFLTENDKSPKYVPSEGERVYLRRNGEFFGQRDAINVMDTLSEKMLGVAEAAANAIPGLSIGGVDMLIDLEKDECIVNEVNSLPQISNHIFPIEGKAIDIPRIIIDHYFPDTKYEDAINPNFYYDFKPILENFRNGTALEFTLPPLPSGEHSSKRFIVLGDKFKNRYLERMIKEAATYRINGTLEVIDDNKIIYTISGAKNKLTAFQKLIEKAPYKFVKINKVKERKYNGPINIGFVVKYK